MSLVSIALILRGRRTVVRDMEAEGSKNTIRYYLIQHSFIRISPCLQDIILTLCCSPSCDRNLLSGAAGGGERTSYSE